MKKFNSVKDELLFIKEQNEGFAAPSKVVKFAENPDTHLHSRFEWDDTKAAYNYRIWEAQRIIRLELTVLENDKKEPVTVRLFTSLVMDRSDDKGYRLTEKVMEVKSLREQLLAEALQELIRIKVKYKLLSELSKVFAAIEELETPHKKVVSTACDNELVY